jgi:hypothetical protein
LRTRDPPYLEVFIHVHHVDTQEHNFRRSMEPYSISYASHRTKHIPLFQDISSIFLKPSPPRDPNPYVGSPPSCTTHQSFMDSTQWTESY